HAQARAGRVPGTRTERAGAERGERSARGVTMQTLDRRTFLATSAAALVGAGAGHAGPTRLRLALAGTGSRGSSMWGRDLTEFYDDRIEHVGLFDRNLRRARAAQGLIGTKAPVFPEFETMLRETRPDAVV